MAQQRCSICKQTGHKKTNHDQKRGVTRCCKCKQEFPTETFPKKKRNLVDGTPVLYVWPVCEICNKKVSKSRYRNSFAQRLSALARTAQQRAKSKGIPFDIDAGYLLELYEQQMGLCAYSGIELSLDTNCDQAVTIDQIRPAQGYIKDNVVLACMLINNMKSNMNRERFLDMCNLVLEHCNEQ